MNFKNAKYLKDGRIKCDVEHPSLGWVPYTASKDDVEEFGRNLFFLISKTDRVEKYSPRKKTNEELSMEVRFERDSKLVEIDSIASNPLRWESFSEEQKDAYRKYRQELLDVPQQPGFPKEIVWPKLKT